MEHAPPPPPGKSKHLHSKMDLDLIELFVIILTHFLCNTLLQIQPVLYKHV